MRDQENSYRELTMCELLQVNGGEPSLNASRAIGGGLYGRSSVRSIAVPSSSFGDGGSAKKNDGESDSKTDKADNTGVKDNGIRWGFGDGQGNFYGVPKKKDKATGDNGGSSVRGVVIAQPGFGGGGNDGAGGSDGSGGSESDNETVNAGNAGSAGGNQGGTSGGAETETGNSGENTPNTNSPDDLTDDDGGSDESDAPDDDGSTGGGGSSETETGNTGSTDCDSDVEDDSGTGSSSGSGAGSETGSEGDANSETGDPSGSSADSDTKFKSTPEKTDLLQPLSDEEVAKDILMSRKKRSYDLLIEKNKHTYGLDTEARDILAKKDLRLEERRLDLLKIGYDGPIKSSDELKAITKIEIIRNQKNKVWEDVLKIKIGDQEVFSTKMNSELDLTEAELKKRDLLGSKTLAPGTYKSKLLKNSGSYLKPIQLTGLYLIHPNIYTNPDKIEELKEEDSTFIAKEWHKRAYSAGCQTIYGKENFEALVNVLETVGFEYNNTDMIDVTIIDKTPKL